MIYLFDTCYKHVSISLVIATLTLHCQKVVILQPGPSTSILDAADASPNNFHGAVVTSEIAQILSLYGSNSFALRFKFFHFTVQILSLYGSNSFTLRFKFFHFTVQILSLYGSNSFTLWFKFFWFKFFHFMVVVF